MSQQPTDQEFTFIPWTREALVAAVIAIIVHFLLMTFFIQIGERFVFLYDGLAVFLLIVFLLGLHWIPRRYQFIRYLLFYLFIIGLIFAALMTGSLIADRFTDNELIVFSLRAVPYFVSCDMLTLFGLADDDCFSFVGGILGELLR